MIPDRFSQTLTLSDGRTLGFAEWGDPDGKPVFYFYGSSSSRLEHPPFESSLIGVRLITVEGTFLVAGIERTLAIPGWPPTEQEVATP